MRVNGIEGAVDGGLGFFRRSRVLGLLTVVGPGVSADSGAPVQPGTPNVNMIATKGAERALTDRQVLVRLEGEAFGRGEPAEQPHRIRLSHSGPGATRAEVDGVSDAAMRTGVDRRWASMRACR